MIRRKVLIVDDELLGLDPESAPASPRDDTYLKVIEQLNQISPDLFYYDPLLCGSEEQVFQELESAGHSNGELLSIVDLVLDENNRFSEIGASELLEEVLKKSRLVFFTTRRLEQAKIGTLVKFQRANRSAGLFPFELLSDQPKEFARLVHRTLENDDEGKAIDYIEHLQKKNFKNINILLISDFHFNHSSSNKAEIDLENVFGKIEDIIKDRRLDLAFLLGDFTDKGKHIGFKTAGIFLDKLISLANFQNVPSDFIRLVPGNHDVVAPLSLSAYIGRSDGKYTLTDDLVDESLLKFGIQPFQHFRERFVQGVRYFGDSVSDEILSRRHWLDFRWTHFGFVMVGFDSNSYPTIAEPVSGSVSEEGLMEFRKILSEVPKERRSTLALIVLAHHYSGDGSGDRGIKERDLLRKYCSELGFKGVVFINGDRHGDPIPQLGRQLVNDGTIPLEIAVPTFCQHNASRQEGASRGAILLTVDGVDGIDGQIGKMAVRSFRFHEGGALGVLEPREYLLDHNGWRKK